jgi:peptidoglycan/LPS O-acetylase OafA/YrhL
MKYRAEIDGLRAVAIIPVVLFHAGVSGFSGGFAGVDVFFVISGYLITSIILTDHAKGEFTLRMFYERRARRILPALFLVMSCTAVAAWYLLLPSAMTSFSRSVLGVLTFSSNFHFLNESGYFDLSSELKPLLHTWSLAVEEQFYILFPLLMLVILRIRKTALLGLTVVLTICSFVVSEWMSNVDPSAAFFLLPYRAWELGLGCIAAIWLFKKTNVNGHQLASFAGLLAVVASFGVLNESTPFPGVFAIPSTLGTVLIILFARQGTWVHWLLSQRALIGLGLISYSLYLWHQPLFAIARYRSATEPSTLLLLALSALAVVLALLTYRYVETPFRKRERLPVFKVALILGPVFVGLAGFAILAKENGGYAFRFDAPEFVKNGEFSFPHTENGWCFYSVNSEPELELGEAGQECFLGDPDGARTALLIGDSYAGQYEPFWDEVGKSMGLKVHSVTTNWCFPSLTDDFPTLKSGRAWAQCQSNRQLFRDNASRYDVVILGGQWSTLDKHGWLTQIDAVLQVLSENKGQLQVVMPNPPQTFPQLVEAAAYGVGQPLEAQSRRDVVAQQVNQKLMQALEGFPSAMMLPRTSLFTDGKGPSSYTDEGKPFSLDGAHISIYGAKKSAATFLESVQFDNLNNMLN